LFFGHADAGVFTDKDERLVAGIAAHAAIAIDNARLFSQTRAAEDALRRANEGLEIRVGERTAELHRLNQDLQVLNDKLQISNRELQDFASVASHDLQEPLRKIQAFGDRLAQRSGPALGPEGLDYLKRMQNAAGRMQTLINDLLAFARVTTKARPFEPVDLNVVAAEVVSDLEARVQQTGGRVDIAPLPTIDADPVQMRQLLQNLIGNALKFTAPGASPVVRVGATTSAEGDAVELFVQDNGIGFDEKYLDRIFNVFQRLHGRDAYEGTGIGLAVCRKIVERHGGSLTARSRAGEGATFLVTLPRHHGTPGEHASQDSQQQAATA
jgi:light-regulated signal transduction histidine kinase (bacteriophytochrome)